MFGGQNFFERTWARVGWSLPDLDMMMTSSCDKDLRKICLLNRALCFRIRIFAPLPKVPNSYIFAFFGCQSSHILIDFGQVPDSDMLTKFGTLR